MANKKIGNIDESHTTYYWGGTPDYHANVAVRAVMPEKGNVLSLKLKLARHSDSDAPIVWGVIWNRNSDNFYGSELVQSTNSVTPTNTEPSVGIYTFEFPKTLIEKDTLMWIGFGRVSNQSGRSLTYYVKSSPGDFMDRYDFSQSSVYNGFFRQQTYSNEKLVFELTYEAGGQIKTWNGSSFVSKNAKVWNGSQWVEKPIKVWNGSIWKDSNS